ncbi:unnamed protein product, partial [Meganyctiphanes norvegica]
MTENNFDVCIFQMVNLIFKYFSSVVHTIRNFQTTHYALQEATEMKETDDYEFQAETRMLLDIVAKSLYSEKEVFVRELVSNASDAIEKARYLALQGAELDSSEATMKIHITTDKYDKTLTIQDSGIGMNKEELINNLGTIARSGSKAFLQEIQEGGSSDPQSIIGQFGVGFYSAFMVAEKVEVYTRSRKPGSVGLKWNSDGSGRYSIEEVEGVEPGTKVVCHLKLSERQFADEQSIKDTDRDDSTNSVIITNSDGSQMDLIEPVLFTQQKQHLHLGHIQLANYISSIFDMKGILLLHNKNDIQKLGFMIFGDQPKVGLFDMNQQSENEVSLYCRRVLIMNKASNVVPKWLRFMKGVVDSEDIPLNLSRELLQDSALIRKLRTVIQNRVVRFLFDRLRKEPENYEKFFLDYGIFIKEGVLSSQEQIEKEEIAKLLTYDSSSTDDDKKTTIPEYIGRMAADQKDVYYLAAPSRELALNSPYFESLKKRGIEVLFCYEPYDEVVLMQLGQFNSKNIVSVEKEMRQEKEAVNFDDAEGSLRKEEANALMEWLKTTLAGRCYGVKATPRLQSHPCVVTVEEMGAARHFVRTQFSQLGEDMRYSLLKPELEINPGHPIIVKLHSIKDSNPHLAELVAKQFF